MTKLIALLFVNIIVGVKPSASQVQNGVLVKWTASQSAVDSYNVYRADKACAESVPADFKALTGMNSIYKEFAFVKGLEYLDKEMNPGKRCYAVTALWINNLESIRSEGAEIDVPLLPPGGVTVTIQINIVVKP